MTDARGAPTARDDEAAPSPGPPPAESDAPARVRWGWTLVSAVLFGSAQCHAALSPLAFVAIAPWLRVMGDPACRRTGWTGPVWTFVVASVALSWTVVVFPLASMVIALGHVHGGWIIERVVRLLTRRGGVPMVVAAALAFPASDWIRAWLGPTPSEYAATGSPAGWWEAPAQVVSWTGHWGLGLAVALINGAVASVWLTWLRLRRERPGDSGAFKRALLARRSVVSLAAAVVLWGGLWAWGATVLAEADDTAGAGDLRVALVQGNVPQEEKNDPDLADRVLGKYASRTRLAVITDDPAERPDLIVWPESTAAIFPTEDESWRERIADIARAADRPVLVGALGLRDGDPSTPTNAVYLFGPDGNIEGVYEKRALVPWGEFLPVLWRFDGLRREFARTLFDMTGGLYPALVPGIGPVVMDPAGDAVPPFGPAICYDTHDSGLHRRQVREGATFMVSCSNEAWFLDYERPQMLAHERLRAIETRRDLVRAVNTGITCRLDAWGRVTHRLEVDREGVLTVPVTARTQVTPFVRWGDWLPILCVVLLALGTAWSFRRPGAGARTRPA